MSILDSDVQLGHAVGRAIRMLGTTMAVEQSTQHGLAHPPTWAHHLGGPAGTIATQDTGAGGRGAAPGPTAIDDENNSNDVGASGSGERDDDDLGEEFQQTYSHVMNALDQAERQAETIGRRAVAIDGLPGGGER
eukprot:3162529-Lingulodinium_polyedra.AAC.1